MRCKQQPGIGTLDVHHCSCHAWKSPGLATVDAWQTPGTRLSRQVAPDWHLPGHSCQSGHLAIYSVPMSQFNHSRWTKSNQVEPSGASGGSPTDFVRQISPFLLHKFPNLTQHAIKSCHFCCNVETRCQMMPVASAPPPPPQPQRPGP